MRFGDFYNHYKNSTYWFQCIALPIEDRNKDCLNYISTARYHEDTHDIDLYISEGVCFIDSDLPHVIYQSEKGIWAREVDDFFGYKQLNNGEWVKRFTLK